MESKAKVLTIYPPLLGNSKVNKSGFW